MLAATSHRVWLVAANMRKKLLTLFLYVDHCSEHYSDQSNIGPPLSYNLLRTSTQLRMTARYIFMS